MNDIQKNLKSFQAVPINVKRQKLNDLNDSFLPSFLALRHIIIVLGKILEYVLSGANPFIALLKMVQDKV